MAKNSEPVQNTNEVAVAQEAPVEVAPEPQVNKRVLAQYVGHAGTTRIIRKEDQDFLIGVDGVAKEDLVWEAGSQKKVDITEVHEDVQTYLRKDEEFKISTVEVPA